MSTSDQTLRYNAKDALVTYECLFEYFPEIDKPAAPGKNTFRETYNHTMDLVEPLMYMQTRGIKVNREALEQEKIKCVRRMNELQAEINSICGREINPNSSQQLQQYFYGEKGIQPYTKLNTKKQSVVTCDDRALQRIARGTATRRPYKEASLIQEWRKLSKLKSTYLEISFDSDNRLRCSYNARGTRFARVSSSQTVFGTGANMQNLHPGVLSFLEADDGCIFISLDKAQAEWVVVAYASGDENMISCIERGEDPHAYTAANMFGVDMELVKEENKILGHESDPDLVKNGRVKIPELAKMVEQNQWLPRTMSMRQCGKKSNHGLNYDESPNMFSLINEITPKEAQVVYDFYHRSYPGIKRYYDWCLKELQDNGRVLENLFGRPYRFLGKWDKELWKSAYSYIPQSTVGELVNRSICGVYYSERRELRDVEILQQVHDNILFQIPLKSNDLGSAILTIKEYMEPTLSASGREFIIGTDLKIGFNLKDMVELPILEDSAQLTQSIREAANGLTQGGGLDNDVS